MADSFWNAYLVGIIVWVLYDLIAFTFWTARKKHEQALKRAKTAVLAPLWPIILGLMVLIVLGVLLARGLRPLRRRLQLRLLMKKRNERREVRRGNRGPVPTGSPGKPPSGGSGISRPKKD